MPSNPIPIFPGGAVRTNSTGGATTSSGGGTATASSFGSACEALGERNDLAEAITRPEKDLLGVPDPGGEAAAAAGGSEATVANSASCDAPSCTPSSGRRQQQPMVLNRKSRSRMSFREGAARPVSCRRPSCVPIPASKTKGRGYGLEAPNFRHGTRIVPVVSHDREDASTCS